MLHVVLINAQRSLPVTTKGVGVSIRVVSDAAVKNSQREESVENTVFIHWTRKEGAWCERYTSTEGRGL